MRTQYITSIGLFYKNRGFYWRVSDCEEFVGVIGDDVTEMQVGIPGTIQREQA